MAMNSLEPTAQEQYMLELVNRARLDPDGEVQRNAKVESLNEDLAAGTISSSPKQPLAFDLDLIESARTHSQWMLEADQFSHTGAGNSSAGDRMKAAGYDFTGSWTWGENLAWQGTTGTPDVNAMVAQQHDNLFDSPGHRTNLMNGSFKQAGIGILTGEFKGYNAVMTTQNFAKSGLDTFLTGVVYDDQKLDDDFYTIGEGVKGVTVEAVRQSDQATVRTTTFGSGGYQLELDPGTYTVRFFGTGVNQPVERTVTLGSENIKLDLATDTLIGVATEAAMATVAPVTAEVPIEAPVPAGVPTEAVNSPLPSPLPAPPSTFPSKEPLIERSIRPVPTLDPRSSWLQTLMQMRTNQLGSRPSPQTLQGWQNTLEQTLWSGESLFANPFSTPLAADHALVDSGL